MLKSDFQQVVENLVKVGLSLLRMIVFSRPLFRHIYPPRNHDRCVILGNGPSLTGMIERYEALLRGCDLFCVNHFPTTPLFERLKPAFFIASAPDLFYDNIEEHFIIQSNRLFESLAAKTTWPLAVFMPAEARKYERWQRHLKQHAYISIYYYNTTPIEGFRGFRHFLFKAGTGMPRPHNIMIPAIWTAINMKYQTVSLWGADHSWLREISVDEQNNALINQKHFYDADTARPAPLDKKGKGRRRLHEILYKFMTAFASYFVLREYADSCGVAILNATNGSFIDAFERITPDTISSADQFNQTL